MLDKLEVIHAPGDGQTQHKESALRLAAAVFAQARSSMSEKPE